jgi:DNA polymerase-3 subunit epsilon
MKLIAFDFETTGRDPERDRVMEFCFIELDAELKELGRWSRIVDPQVPIPKEIQDLTGITPEMVLGQPPFSLHAPRIQQLVEGATLIAHSHQFDLQFLNKELRLAGQPGVAVDHPCIDTLHIERRVNSHRLGETFQRYTGQEMAGAHRSEADTAATVEVLRCQRAAHAAALPPTLAGLVVPELERHFEGEEGARSWLDHGHRFYKDHLGTIRFGFGKYRGEPALDHADYLLWMKGKDFPADCKATIDMILKARPAPAAAPATPQAVPAPAKA